MPDVIFARPRWEYQSYSDLWKLVALSGYPVVYMDEIEPDSDRCYIFTTPDTHWHHGWPGARARIIYYSIEWYLDVDYQAIPGVEVWAADAWYARRIGARYVPMGSHRELNCEPDREADKRFDLVTLWAASGRRYTALDFAGQAGLTVAPNGWGEERHRILQESRAMYIVHQNDNAPAVAPQRWAVAAAYHLPVITENLADEGIFTKHYRIMNRFHSLAGYAAVWLKTDMQARLVEYGHALYRLLCEEKTFRRTIEAAL